jgi:hypothetical protein
MDTNAVRIALSLIDRLVSGVQPIATADGN